VVITDVLVVVVVEVVVMVVVILMVVVVVVVVVVIRLVGVREGGGKWFDGLFVGCLNPLPVLHWLLYPHW
jgi:hypothetical protein